MMPKPVPPLRYRVYRGLWRLFWEALGFLVVIGGLVALAGGKL